MDRVTRGFHLLAASLKVLRSDRELIVLPIIAMVATVAVGATLAGAGWVSGLFEAHVEETEAYARYLLLGIFYFTAYTIGIFFNAAVVAAAMIRIEGGDPSLGDGLRAAWSSFDKILAWAAIAATVGLILNAIRDRGGLLGAWVGRIAGVAWTAVTFFVIPVILFERVGVGNGIKRSALIFRQRWGEQFVGNVAINLALLAIMFVLLVVLLPIAVAAPPVGLTMIALAMIALFAVGNATTGVFNAALYKYAATGEGSGPFAAGDLSSAFLPAPARRGRGSGFGVGATPPMTVGPPRTLEQYVADAGLPTSVEEAQRRRDTGGQGSLFDDKS